MLAIFICSVFSQFTSFHSQREREKGKKLLIYFWKQLLVLLAAEIPLEPTESLKDTDNSSF